MPPGARRHTLIAALVVITVLLMLWTGATGTARAQGRTIKPHHAELHFECTTCHADGFRPLGTQDCLACHGSFERLAERTADLGYDDNVHASPHYPEMDCDLCHREHEASTNYCTLCHRHDSMMKLETP